MGLQCHVIKEHEKRTSLVFMSAFCTEIIVYLLSVATYTARWCVYDCSTGGATILMSTPAVMHVFCCYHICSRTAPGAG